MTFARVNPPGWAVGDQLTSAQQNQLDIDHTKALNGGNADGVLVDTLHTQIQLSPTGTISAAFAGGITGAAAAAIQSVHQGGFQTEVAGGLSLNGGANDWPQFGDGSTSPRTRLLIVPPIPFGALQSGWTLPNALPVSGFGITLSGPGSTQPQVVALPNVHRGATLASVTAFLSVANHSNVPSTMPAMTVYRAYALNNGHSLAETIALSSSVTQSFPTPANGAAWTDGNAIQSWTYVCNQNNVIDNTTWPYFIVLTDENGANAVTGNQYLGFLLTFTNIQDMRFP